MNRIYILFIAVSALFICSCKKEEHIRPENAFMMNEDSQKGQMSVDLHWSVNGITDNGMIADISIYLTPSDYENIGQLDGPSTMSSMDYYGGQSITPSNNDLLDLYRHYVGVGFNGLLTTDPSVTFPLTIDYTITVQHENDPLSTKTIQGTFIIEDHEKTMTKIIYPCFMDINDSNYSDKYRSYSFREIEQPLITTRKCDVTITNIMEANHTFTIEARWKTSNNSLGYEKIDLDLFLHDTTTIPYSYEDLDASSSYSGSYEKLYVSSPTSIFDNGNPKFMGFLYDSDLGLNTNEKVKIMFKITSYGNTTIHRYVGYYTFDPALLSPGDGSMYVLAKVMKQNNEYVITNLPSVVVFND